MCDQETKKHIITKTLLWLIENNISFEELVFLLKEIESKADFDFSRYAIRGIH